MAKMKKTKMYAATVTVTVVIEDEDKPREWDIVRYARKELANVGLVGGITIKEINDLRNVPKGWRESTAWGHLGGGMTVEEVLRERRGQD